MIEPEATAHWTGPERRHSTENARREWQAQFRLKRALLLDGLKRVGILSSGLVLIMGGFWVGRVESHIAAGDEAMKSLAVTVKAVADLAESVKALQEENRQEDEARTKILVQLEKLNGQIEVLRADQRRAP